MRVNVIGAGLAGCEAAYYLAQRGVEVTLWDIKPKSFTPVHKNGDYAELVCSNSLKGSDCYANACGLLKEEMRVLGSLIIRAADNNKVPAGGALAVERDAFARYITNKVRSHPNISCECKEAERIPEGAAIIATGPLTCGALAEDIKQRTGGGLYFYDASAPIVTKESIDFKHAFTGDRYGKGGDDYINCPLSKEEYYDFCDKLVNAEKAAGHSFDKREFFEGCMPLEVMAARGQETLRFGPFKPVGLTDADGNKFFAVLQLRKENVQGSAYNLVGCQTNLKFGEQKRVFSIIPALKNAEFLRYGVMHRNSYINSPENLNGDFSLKESPFTFFAGQITGVEGYVESAASGLLAAIGMYFKLSGKTAPAVPPDTICGALSRHVSTKTDNFQPMNANFGLLHCDKKIRDKKERYRYLAERALDNIQEYNKLICQ